MLGPSAFVGQSVDCFCQFSKFCFCFVVLLFLSVFIFLFSGVFCFCLKKGLGPLHFAAGGSKMF